MLRRSFLESVPGAVAATALAAPPPAPDAPIKLGFDTYSLRAFQWKAPQLLDYAASLKLDTIQISSLGDYESLDAAYLRKVKDQADRLGIQVDGGTGCICPSSRAFSKNGPPARDRVLQGLRVAKAMGAKAMRCYLGTGADRIGEPGIEACMRDTIQVFRSVRAEARDLGVKIAIENHDGDMQAREVKTIIEESGKDFVGSNLDTGNPLWVAEDPMVTLEVLAPYVVTSHIRDSVLFEHPRGGAGQWVVLGDGQIDFARFVERFHQWCPQASMQMEVITGRPPRIIPYLETDFWKAFPTALASEFARFVALAKQGHPYMGAMVIEDVAGQPRQAIMTEALKQQQRLDLERSLEYAKKKLNVGVHWRA
jgi:sugar phosphate isomerase/epimerase